MRTIGNGDSERSTKVMHPSDMSHKEWCGRHDYYRIIDTPIEKTSKANPSFRMENVFAEGHAIHRQVPDTGCGRWACSSGTGCASTAATDTGL